MLAKVSKVVEDSTRGGFYLTLGSLTSIIVSVLSVFIIARILGSELYGLYTLSTVFPSLLLLFTNPGINQGIIKFSASLRVKEEKHRLQKLMLHSLSFSLILGFIGFLACFIFSGQFATHILNRSEATGFIQIAAALVIFQATYDTINSAFIGVDKTEYNATLTILQAVIRAVIAPALVILGLAITGAVIGYVFSYVLVCLLGLYLFLSKIYKPLKCLSNNSNDNSNDLRMLIRYGFPLYISVLISGFIVQYQNIILAFFTSNYAVGNFQAALNFTIFLTSLSLPIANILLPAFSKLEEKKEAVKEFFKISVKYTSLLILPIAILLMIFAEEIVPIIYGEGYELTASFFLLYGFMYFLMGLGFTVLRSFFNGLGQTKINLRITLVNAVILLVLAPILTWSIGVNGMILSLILGSLFSTLYGLYAAKKLFSVEIDRKMVARIYLAVVISALPLLIMKQIPLFNNLIKVIIGLLTYLAVYLLILPMIKVVSPTEIQEIKRVVGKVKLLKYLALPILYCEEKILMFLSRKL